MSLSRLLNGAMSCHHSGTTRLFIDSARSILQQQPLTKTGLFHNISLGYSTLIGGRTTMTAQLKYLQGKSNTFRGLKHIQKRTFKTKTPKQSKELVLIEGERHTRLLWKPLIFTVVFTAVTFTSCIMWKLESVHKMLRSLMKGEKPEKNSSRPMNSHAILIASIVGCNAAVFSLWRFALGNPTLKAFLTKFFTGNLFRKSRCLSMIGCAFSHTMFWHIFFNMYVLWSFRGGIQFMEKEEFVAFYGTAAVVSSFASYMHMALLPFTQTLAARTSVGASGAILGVLAAVLTQNPDTRLQIALIGDIIPHSFDGRQALLFLVVLDTIGILRGWSAFDHAGHLGGVLFGIWYMKYGRDILWRKPEKHLMQFWHKVRFGNRKDK